MLMRSGRVLIVEDEAEAGEALQEALRDDGFDVVLASSAVDALRLVERWRPDVALVDIGLPGLDGYALTGALRRRADLSESIWILAVTARAGAVDRQKALACGMDMFLSKPVDPDDLGRTLHSLVEATRKDGLPAPARLPSSRREKKRGSARECTGDEQQR
jgi:CheY-like chemotaxis protein